MRKSFTFVRPHECPEVVSTAGQRHPCPMYGEEITRTANVEIGWDSNLAIAYDPINAPCCAKCDMQLYIKNESGVHTGGPPLGSPEWEQEVCASALSQLGGPVLVERADTFEDYEPPKDFL